MNNSFSNIFFEDVCRRYRFQKISSIEKEDNVGWVITADKKTFLLKEIYFVSRIKHLLYEISFCNYLAKCGFPAQRIQKTETGSFIMKHNDSIFYLIEYTKGAYIPTSNKELSIKQLIEAGKTLGKLHQLSVDYKGPKYHKIPFNSKKTLIKLAKISNEIGLKPNTNSFDILAKLVIEKKIAFILKNPFESLTFLSQEQLMNHGDFHAGNLVFNETDEVIAVLDFEFCSEISRLWDIAWALTWLSKVNNTEAFSGILDPLKAKSFLQGYEGLIPITEDERISLKNLLISSSYHSTYLLEQIYVKKIKEIKLSLCQNEEEWLWLPNNIDTLL